MKALIKTAAVMVVCTILSSCASIIHGSTQTVDITSQPVGASITIDGKDYGQTPKTIELRRKGRLKGELDTKKFYAVKLELNGYEPYEIKIKRELDAWFFGNLLFGGVIGMIVDAADGAMYKLTPDQLIAQMGKQIASNETLKNSDGIYIAVIMHADPSWERVGTLTKKAE